VPTGPRRSIAKACPRHRVHPTADQTPARCAASRACSPDPAPNAHSPGASNTSAAEFSSRERATWPLSGILQTLGGGLFCAFLAESSAMLSPCCKQFGQACITHPKMPPTAGNAAGQHTTNRRPATTPEADREQIQLRRCAADHGKTSSPPAHRHRGSATSKPSANVSLANPPRRKSSKRNPIDPPATWRSFPPAVQQQQWPSVASINNMASMT